MTIPPIPIARPDLAAVSPDYRIAMKAFETAAREFGFGDTYTAMFSLVQREARKAERMLAERASA